MAPGPEVDLGQRREAVAGDHVDHQSEVDAPAAHDGQRLEEAVGQLLRHAGKTVAVAESCTGGLICHRITNVPGSSDYFERGIVAYSNESKTNLLGIPSSVIERHGVNGNHANGFVQGFGLKKGAIASTVGHDSHNICVVGVNEEDMALAANRLGEIKGGFVVVEDGKVTGEIALPVAGLMSLEPYESVRDTLHHLRHAAFALGATLEEPFLQLAFLPLPVIPHLKITDFGLFDVDRFELVAPG